MLKFTLSALLVAGCFSMVIGEDAKPPRNAPSGQSSEPQGAQRDHADVERSLAACVAIKNQEEIALTQFALEHIQDPEVKKFAQMIIDDHTKYATKLASYAGEGANKPVDGSNQRTADQSTLKERDVKTPPTTGQDKADTERQQVKPAEKDNASETGVITTGHGGHGKQDRMTAIERQVANECLSLAKKELNEAKERANLTRHFWVAKWELTWAWLPS